MAQNITWLGASYTGVEKITLPKTGGGTARFDDASVTTATASNVASGKIFLASDGTITTGTASGGGSTLITKSITANGTYNASSDNADGYSSVTVNVPANPLLATLSLGTISTSSTTAADTGKSITVSGINSYDALIFETSVDTKVNNRHACTTALIWLTASSNVSTKNGATIASNRWNCKLSSNGTATTRQSTTAYGIYPYAVTIGTNSASITIYQRYNSTQTGTINGSYTARVYGVKIYDLIGG